MSDPPAINSNHGVGAGDAKHKFDSKCSERRLVGRLSSHVEKLLGRPRATALDRSYRRARVTPNRETTQPVLMVVLSSLGHTNPNQCHICSKERLCSTRSKAKTCNSTTFTFDDTGTASATFAKTILHYFRRPMLAQIGSNPIEHTQISRHPSRFWPRWGRHKWTPLEFGSNVLKVGGVHPNTANFALNRPMLGRLRPALGRRRPSWTKFGPRSTKFGPKSAESDQNLAGIDQTCPGIVQNLLECKVSQVPTKADPKSANTDRSWPTIQVTQPEVD